MFLLKRKSSDMICYHRQEDITPSYKIFTGRADAESEAPILWPPDAKSRLIGRLMLGEFEGKRRRRRQRMKWFDGITNSMDMNLSTLLEIVEDRGAWLATVHRVADSWT